METTYDYQMLDAIVNRVLATEDITLGTPQQPFLVRYRGRLRLEDSEQSYDQLAAWLKPYHITPLFRMDEGRHAILLIPGLPEPKPSNPMINLGLAILTVVSVLIAQIDITSLPSDFWQAVLMVISTGWPFAVSMLAILAAHEFGHYLMGRFHGVHVTLPYFIPMPFTPFGTMGAFINMKEPAKNRKVLLDIGIAGPLTGLAIAIPVLLIGLSLSEVGRVQVSQGGLMEGNSILYLFSKFLVFGQFLPAPASYGNMNPIFYWLRYFFTSTPVPVGGWDVFLHPVAWAGWAGLLVTTMNLIPAGQLDGGHILYVLLGRNNAQRVLPLILAALIILGFVWQGWWIWAGLIFLLGRVYAEPLDQITPLDNLRKWLAVLALLVFVVTFIPVPLSLL